MNRVHVVKIVPNNTKDNWNNTPSICDVVAVGAAIGAAVVASDAYLLYNALGGPPSGGPSWRQTRVGWLYNAQNSYAASANMTTPRTMRLPQSDVSGEVEATPATFVVELTVVELTVVGVVALAAALQVLS